MFYRSCFYRSCFYRSFLYRSFSILVLALAAAWAQQTIPDTRSVAQPAVPDTPAGRTFKAWLEAFNSGDRGQI
ncbi:MAG: hypothetical protein WCA49_13900, partial [Candidatus Sulfotelmatobacter sp.]